MSISQVQERLNQKESSRSRVAHTSQKLALHGLKPRELR
jgi:hypothetical protein